MSRTISRSVPSQPTIMHLQTDREQPLVAPHKIASFCRVQLHPTFPLPARTCLILLLSGTVPPLLRSCLFPSSTERKEPDAPQLRLLCRFGKTGVSPPGHFHDAHIRGVSAASRLSCGTSYRANSLRPPGKTCMDAYDSMHLACRKDDRRVNLPGTLTKTITPITQ